MVKNLLKCPSYGQKILIFYGRKNMKCPYCGSEKIEIGIAWGKSAETGNVGLKYSTSGIFAITGVVQVYSDLCLDCKSIIKSYIKEDTDKKWCHNPGAIGSK